LQGSHYLKFQTKSLTKRFGIIYVFGILLPVTQIGDGLMAGVCGHVRNANSRIGGLSIIAIDVPGINSAWTEVVKDDFKDSFCITK
jgi:hypothetical protein